MYVITGPDGKHILTTIRMGMPGFGTHLLVKTAPTEWPALYTTYSPDGKLAASGNYDKTIIIWDTQTGEQLKTLSGHTDIVLQSVSPDGRPASPVQALMAQSSSGFGRGNAWSTLQGDSDYQTSVAYSPGWKVSRRWRR
ncbi:hypothetical protein [Candidatus Villigracilis affinis]|uniref:WD40 repeat domain-containing protein n=1 Tax=Candidatus Villigracilis affinis TaxID=3140682 RepID=UPI001DE413CF|nr:hypothetical protein [Anaerolineales bacterium]